jgi:hypothetical protein
MTPTIYSIGGLVVALLLSAAANLYQWQAGKAAAAECEAARLQVVADIATGTAAAEKEHADKVAAIANDVSPDEKERLRILDEATKRINGAASRYASASKSAPLPPDCRASADRVQAVNTARGQ